MALVPPIVIVAQLDARLHKREEVFYGYSSVDCVWGPGFAPVGRIEGEITLHSDGMCRRLGYEHLSPNSLRESACCPTERSGICPLCRFGLGCGWMTRCLQYVRRAEHVLEDGVEHHAICRKSRSRGQHMIAVGLSDVDPKYWPLLVLRHSRFPRVYDHLEDQCRPVTDTLCGRAEEKDLLQL